MTDPQRRRPQHEILDDLREYGDRVTVFEEELQIARDDVGHVLLEGFLQRVEMSWMAEAAGISRQTAYKLLHKAQRRAARDELFDKLERMAELGRMESRDEHEEAEYRRLLADEELERFWSDI